MKIIVSVLIFAASYFYTFNILGALAANIHFSLPYIFASILAGFITWIYWTTNNQANAPIRNYTIRGGLIVGAISFTAGFIGPIIFMPESNLGPLLGIFFTGPIGFIVGLIGGWIYGYNKSRKNHHQHMEENQ